MQSIQVDGTFTYSKNIKDLKIGDQIKLIPNPSNRLNSEAVGAYTLTGLKIGYIPFKVNQIDIKSKYTVTKINLTQENPLLLISRQFDPSNFIQSEPNFIKQIKYSDKSVHLDSDLSYDLKHFYNYLVKSGNQITNLKITYQDPNFVNLFIETPEAQLVFWTVTKKYYEENIFKYDEFYKFKLIPKCIYQQFQIHRLEVYLEKHYKPINKLLSMKKFKLESLIKSDIFDFFDKIHEENFGFDTINSSNLKTIKKSNISHLINNDLFEQEQLDNLTKLIIQFGINPNPYFNPVNYLKCIDSDSNLSFTPELEEFKNIFNDIKLGGLCYNHQIKYYCQIDLYDDINIVDIWTSKKVNKEKLVEMLLKLIISNKQIINLYNPLEGTILRLEIPELIRTKISNIISK
jgi:hypothetical protein